MNVASIDMPSFIGNTIIIAMPSFIVNRFSYKISDQISRKIELSGPYLHLHQRLGSIIEDHPNHGR
jgi:hypothetical protein